MSTTRAVANNTMIQVAGRAIGTLLGLLTVAVMTRHLGRSGYGEFTTVMSFLQFFGIVADFGLTLTMVRLISDVGKDEDRVASNVFSMRAALGLILFALAPVVALFFPYPPIVKTAILVAAASHYGNSLSQVLVGVFQKHLSVHRAAIAEVSGRAVLLAGTVAVAARGMGLLALIVVLVAANLLQFAITFALAQRHARIRLAFEPELWKEIFRVSWPIGLSILFNLIYLKGDVIVLSLTRPAAEVGLYGAAYKVLDVVTAVPMIFMGLVLPLLAASWSMADRDGFLRKLSRAFDFLSLLALPLAFGAFPVADDLMRLVAGKDFAASGPYLAILMLAGASVFWGALFGHAIVAIDLQRKMIWMYAVDGITALALYALLIPRHGALAAAWITVGSELFIAVVAGIAVTAVLKKTVSFTAFGKALLASALMMLVVYAVPGVPVLLRILIGAATYGALITVFRAISPETLALLRRKSTV